MPDNLTDPSHSTEQFRAFASGSGSAEPTGSLRNRLVVIGAIVIAVVAIVVIVLAVS